MTRKLIWQFWKNPLGGGSEYVWEKNGTPPARHDDDDDRPAKTPVRPFVMTPAGLVPVSVYGDVARNFNLWVGHTTFAVSECVDDRVQEVQGVESYERLTPLRFRVGVGLAFDDRVVRRGIEQALAANDFDPEGMALDAEASGKVEAIKEVFIPKYRNWAVYVLPNGAIDTHASHDDRSYLSRLGVYQQAREAVGGLVLTSNDL